MKIRKVIEVLKENVSVGKCDIESCITDESMRYCKEWIEIQEMAIQALEEKLEREENKPLTLSELEDMEDEPTPIWDAEAKEWLILLSVYNGEELEFHNCITVYEDNRFYKYEQKESD